MKKTKAANGKSTSNSWPASAPETWPLERIIPYPNNPRTHPAEQITLLAKLMQKHGVDQPIVVDEEGFILKGHGRRSAAAEAGFETFPVVIHRGLSDNDKRAIRLADNQVALLSGWNEQMLRVELTDLSNAGYDMPLLGFDNVQLVSFMAAAPTGADPEVAPEPPADPVSRPGDLWLLGKHRLLCGDSTKAENVERVLGGKKPNLMVTDPPYGVDYDPEWRNRVIRANGTRVAARAVGVVSNDDRSDWTDSWLLFPGDVAYVWHGGMHAGTVQASLEKANLHIRAQIIWAKQHAAIGRSDYHWRHEPCWYAVRKGGKGHWASDRKQTTVWDIDKPQKSETGHSTQKPVECMRRPIQNNSKPGDYVYEPFSGSGTTIIAAEMMNRYALAIELNPVYVDVAVLRWETFSKGTAILESTGQTFDEVRKSRLKNSSVPKLQRGKTNKSGQRLDELVPSLLRGAKSATKKGVPPLRDRI